MFMAVKVTILCRQKYTSYSPVPLGRTTLAYTNQHRALRKMCILFMHLGDQDPESDFSLILAANRDQYYDRPSKTMHPWAEDQAIIGGIDLQAGSNGGTWLALCPKRKRIGALLNLPGRKTSTNCKTRGKIVQEFMKSNICTKDYIHKMREYCKECNHFVFASVELSGRPKVQTYSNRNDKIITWRGTSFGFSNSLPENPLMKAIAGKEQLQRICRKYKKISEMDAMAAEVTKILKSETRYFPDPFLTARQPFVPEQFSSIFVRIPEHRYGTRTHTIIFVKKTGQIHIIEMTMQEPINVESPKWVKSEFQFDDLKIG